MVGGLTSGFTDRLGLTKSSTFLAHVTLHELSQVPLVNAKFRVKFKFKGATTASHLEGLGDDASSIASSSHKRTTNYLHPDSASDHDGSSTGRSSSKTRGHKDTVNSRDSMEGYSSGGSTRPSGDYSHLVNNSSPPLSPTISPDQLRTPNPNRTPSQHQSSTFGNYSFEQSPTNSDKDYSGRGGGGGASGTSGAELGHSKSNTYSLGSLHSTREDEKHSVGDRRGAATLLPSPIMSAPRAEAKGTTSLVPLRSHVATFLRDIQCPVAIPLKSIPGTSRYQLQPSSLKLSVKQEVLGEGGKKEEAKTGHVILDLSQFVGNGRKASEGTPRRYLLHDCKTNATLKVTVRMEWVGGEGDFVAPPLKSGQYHESSSSVPLSNNSFNKSSSSVNSARKASGASSIATNMSRTNSSSSISVNSVPLRTAPSQTRGWRPNGSGFAFSSSPSPTLLGGNTNQSERCATDIVETIFNRPSRQNSWGGFHQFQSSEPNSLNSSTSHQLQVPNSNSNQNARPKNVSRTNTKDGLSDDGALIFAVGKSRPSPPIKKASSILSATTIPATRRGPLSRQPTSSSTNSKSRSVRWGDDTPPDTSNSSSQDSSPQRSHTIPPAVPLNAKEKSSLGDKLRGRNNEKRPGIEWNDSWA